MRKKQFKAESKRLLDLMVNSIYTHKEIFLRELISNASDAIDKLYYHALQDGNTGLSRDDFAIHITLDKKNRTLTVSDNGCGMTQEDLENNLGVIAQSGSLSFKKENEAKEEIDIIGQFGVGFYSAFMVADHICVTSKAYGSDTAFRWESDGADGYTIEECEKNGHGTEIVLKIKPSGEEENYDEFLDCYRIKALVKKYSDYIRYPIKMDMEKSRLKEGSKDEYENYMENETLNSMVPIWKKNKNELKEEDYQNFYKDKFMDFENPTRIIHSNAEGSATYNALLFIPASAPYNYYSRDYEKGLQLYASGVLIMDKCADLLPDCFSFVRGLVDSQDLSLNISREMLQQDRQLKIIASRLEKKIASELSSMLKNQREEYEKFFKNFGLQLKYGVYSSYGEKKDLLKDLLLFYSSSEKKPVTLQEYVSRMKEEQKYIYYACGESIQRIDLLPQCEALKAKGYEILYLTDDIDEFALKILHNYEEKEFRSVAASDLGLESKEQKEQAEKQQQENKELLQILKEALGDKVADVKISSTLTTHPVCLSSQGDISLEMEKVLNSMPSDQKVKAERVLEINPSHPVFSALNKVYSETDGKEKLKEYANLLYTQAMLIEGLPIENPVAFADAVCGLIAQANQ